MSRILVLGGGGLLGSEFVSFLGADAVSVLGKSDLNPSEPAAVTAAIASRAPQIVINCAAHTDLEAAEQDPRLSDRVNGELPGVVASACRQIGARMVHFSSTGCYGSWKSEPYTEEDALRPPTAHHRAKVEGERRVLANGCACLILRTGWLYGGDAGLSKNFVWKRLNEAKSQDVILSDDAQRGCPTYTLDLVKQVMHLLESGASGIYNAVSVGDASRYEYVKAIVESASIDCDVQPGPAFRRLAPVSSNEMAVNGRLKRENLLMMPFWKESLRRYVAELGVQ